MTLVPSDWALNVAHPVSPRIQARPPCLTPALICLHPSQLATWPSVTLLPSWHPCFSSTLHPSMLNASAHDHGSRIAASFCIACCHAAPMAGLLLMHSLLQMVGPILAREPRPLPADLQGFLDDAQRGGRGAIYVSMVLASCLPICLWPLGLVESRVPHRAGLITMCRLLCCIHTQMLSAACCSADWLVRRA